MMDNEVRLTGGFRGYKAAINEGFTTSTRNPTLRYSDSRGFHIESGLTPADSDAVEIGECYYRMSDDGDHRNFRSSYRGYLEVKSIVIKGLYGFEQGIDFDIRHELEY